MSNTYTPKQQAVAIDKKGTVYLLTPISLKILKLLSEYSDVPYSFIVAMADVSKATLMVYAQRLSDERCGLVKKKTGEDGLVYLNLKRELRFDVQVVKV